MDGLKCKDCEWRGDEFDARTIGRGNCDCCMDYEYLCPECDGETEYCDLSQKVIDSGSIPE